LTEKGRRYAEASTRLLEDEIRRLARPTGDSAVPDAPFTDTPRVEPVAPGSPADNIRVAMEDIQQSLRRNLLDLVEDRNPQFFEQLVLRLLRAIGYGVDSSSIEHTGRPGDEGVISLDQLGLDKICVQAKRYDRDRAVAGYEGIASSPLSTASARPRECSSPPDASPRARGTPARVRAERPSG